MYAAAPMVMMTVMMAGRADAAEDTIIESALPPLTLD